MTRFAVVFSRVVHSAAVFVVFVGRSVAAAAEIRHEPMKRVFRHPRPNRTVGVAMATLLIAGTVSAEPPKTARKADRPAPFVANYDESKIPAYSLPETLVTESGEIVNSPGQWPARRAELLDLYRKHVFGRMPAQRNLRVEVVRRDPTWNDGKTIRYELTVTLLPIEFPVDLSRIQTEGLPLQVLALQVLVDVPAGASVEKPCPAFLGLNFQGNHTVTDDPLVRIPPSWVRDRRNGTTDGNTAIEAGRNVAGSRWPAAMINERGYALVTLYYGDIDPDFDDGFEDGVHGLLASWIQRLPAGERPGSIAAWTYGLQAVLDAIEQTPELGINAQQVAVVGHSRLGKTSLWAGAVDPRFSLVVSNDSGCGGAALSRRAIGETVGRINRSFPHWFCDRFNDYNENEKALPIDQHQLIALTAPRPIAIGSATDDEWADPKGEFLSGIHASPVYELLGKPGLIDDQGETPTEMPAADQAYQSGTISYHLREGKHDLTEHDWLRYLAFYDRHLLK